MLYLIIVLPIKVQVSAIPTAVSDCLDLKLHGLLARYVKLRVAHGPGIQGTFSQPPLVSDPDMHHDTCMTHVPWCMPGSLTSGFLWSRWRGKRSRHSHIRIRNTQFYVSGKRTIGLCFYRSPHLHCGCLVQQRSGSTLAQIMASNYLNQYWLVIYEIQ